MSSKAPEGWSWHKLARSLKSRPKSRLASGESDQRGYYDFYICSKKVLKSFHNEHSSSSVLLSTGGEAAVHLANENYSFSTDVWATVFDGEICNEYVFHLLEKNIETINYLGFQGSGIRHLEKDFIKKLEFPFPPLPEQKKIASILTSVDKVIENTQKQIDKLQDLKKSTINELVTKGIGHNEFKDSELGMIPKSWMVQSLRELSSKVGSGVTPKGGESAYQDHGIIFIRSQNVHFDNLILDDVAHISEKIHSGMKGSMVCGGDVLLNITGASIGRCAVVPNNFPESNVNQHVCIIRPLNSLCNNFLNICLSSDYGQDQIMRFQAGGSREGLNFEQIRSIQIPVPPTIQEQQKASEIVNSIQVSISGFRSKLANTQFLKKSLMQDLLTGKVRVTVN
tara:strand:+ start:2059 stop:3246 length:1188 start_codon:yes stop_codon:yes gene_type:complete